MKKFTLSMIVALAVCVAAAVAQTQSNPGGSQGTEPSSPGMGQQQPGSTSPGMGNPSAGAGQEQTTNQTNPAEKGEKKIKGCVQSQGGQYVLESKHGKAIALTGQDVSAHVGHEVAVKGNWESGSSGMSSTSTPSAGGKGASEKTFNVTSVEMISDTCGGKSSGKGSSSGMGAGAAGGSTSSGAGNSSGSTPTAPPQ